MILGTRTYGYGDVRKIQIDYCDWLTPGYVLSGVTASITPTTGITSTVTSPATLSPDEKTAYITLTCGVVNESFTLNVVAVDTFGQTVNDTLNVNVVTPGAT